MKNEHQADTQQNNSTTPKEEPQEPDTNLHFEPSAYLQRLIGRELVADRYVALAEFVKNSFDADANKVTLTLYQKEPQRITVVDNGSGMTLEEFKRFWMSPGYSQKSDIRPKSGERPLLGEKGIGRFAADKLAQRLTVVTKRASDNESLCVDFDWSAFENRELKMNEVDIPFVRQIDSSFDRYHSGTKLEFEHLREKWELKDWRKLRRELQNLVTPFQGLKRFEIIAECIGGTKAWESGKIKSPVETKDAYRYSFELTKGGRLRHSIEYPKKVRNMAQKPLPQTEDKDVAFPSFGPIQGAFYYVEKASELKKIDFEPGIGIYRDGFRVEPYGREENDWLNVKGIKASRQGHAPITPNRLFGYIQISRYDNPELKDRSNREGLLDTPQFEEFINFIKGRFDQFSEIIGNILEEVDTELSPPIAGQRSTESRENRAQAFGEMTSQMAHQLRQPLSVVRSDAKNIRNYLDKNNYLDSFTAQALNRIDEAVKRLDGNIESLKTLSLGLQQQPEEIELYQFVSQLCQNFAAEAQGKNVSIEISTDNSSDKINFGQASLNFILDNMISNAIRAAATTPPGIVKVKFQKHSRGNKRRLSITDNGQGIDPLVKESLFLNTIDNSIGSGEGLYWSRMHAEAFRATLGCENIPSMGATFYIEFD